MIRKRKRSLFLLIVSAAEFINATGGINETLLAREERMAGGADADADVFHRGAGVIDSAAGAGDGGIVTFGMSFLFHGRRM